jgi:hypothetical protein
MFDRSRRRPTNAQDVRAAAGRLPCIRTAVLTAIAAAAMFSPAAHSSSPPKFITHANLAWTLRFRDHGKIVRTVSFNQVDQLTAGDLAVWRHKPGGFYYWEVDFLGNNVAESRLLCGRLCVDIEPGHESDGAPFNNLSATATAVIGGRNKIILQGTVNIDGNGSIATVSVDRWVSPHLSRGGLMFDTPRPIGVIAGQQLVFTLVMSVAAPHG